MEPEHLSDWEIQTGAKKQEKRDGRNMQTGAENMFSFCYTSMANKNLITMEGIFSANTYDINNDPYWRDKSSL